MIVTGQEVKEVKRCAEAYANLTVKLLCYFVHFALGRLNRFNQVFQSEGCQVLDLESATKELLKAYLLNFVKADVVSTADDITKIEYSYIVNQKVDTELSIGQQCSRYLCTIEDECGPAAIKCFYNSVRKEYIATVDKLLKKFPFNSDMLQAVRLLNPNNRLLLTEKHVLLVAEKVLPNSTDDQLDNLHDEWKIYQAASDLPDFNGQDVDRWWVQVLARKDYNCSGVFTELSKLIRILLVLP